MPDGHYRILCVDDNEIVCEAIVRWLGREPGFTVVGTLPTADALVEEVERTQADVVFLDMNMPGKDPIDAAKELLERRPRTRVIALSASVAAELIDRALEAGAAAYISKDDEPEFLTSAIRRVDRGEVVLGPEVQRAYIGWGAGFVPASGNTRKGMSEVKDLVS